MIRQVEKERIAMQMELDMLVSGFKISRMAREEKSGLMDKITKDNIVKDVSMVKDCFASKMRVTIKENFFLIKFMEKVSRPLFRCLRLA